MSPTLQNRNAPTKTCTAPGCGGMMTLHGGQAVASGDGEDGASGAAWVCDTDPSHSEGLTAAERRGMSGR